MQEAAEWWETQGKYSDVDLGPWGRAVFRNGWDKRNELTMELLEALEDCDRAFAGWQVGVPPGRPEDILTLIVKVRAAIKKARGPQ